jgi:hypothetical protein
MAVSERLVAVEPKRHGLLSVGHPRPHVLALAPCGDENALLSEFPHITPNGSDVTGQNGRNVLLAQMTVLAAGLLGESDDPALAQRLGALGRTEFHIALADEREDDGLQPTFPEGLARPFGGGDALVSELA